MQNTLTENFQQEDYLLDRTNNLQIKLAERLDVDLEEFTKYYSEVSRNLINRVIYKTNSTMLTTERFWSWLENHIYIYLLRNYFSGKVEKIVQE